MPKLRIVLTAAGLFLLAVLMLRSTASQVLGTGIRRSP
jgi:hypothetical protein